MLLIVWLLPSFYVNAGTFDRIKTKLNTYIDENNLTLVQLRAFTDQQIINWLNNNYPKTNKRAVKIALAEIILEKEIALVSQYMGSEIETIRNQYPEASWKYNPQTKVITIKLEDSNDN